MKECTFSYEGKKYRVVEIWSKKEIQKMVERLAKGVALYFKKFVKPEEKIVVLTVLDGTLFFGADLMRELGKYFPPEVLCLETLAVYSYKRDHPERVRIDKEPKNPIAGKHVLVVEDIVDTGGTLKTILKKLAAEEPLSLTVCTLIDKKGRRKFRPKIHFVGFELKKPWFLIGYGLDFAGIGRQFEWIGKMEEVF